MGGKRAVAESMAKAEVDAMKVPKATKPQLITQKASLIETKLTPADVMKYNANTILKGSAYQTLIPTIGSMIDGVNEGMNQLQDELNATGVNTGLSLAASIIPAAK